MADLEGEIPEQIEHVFGDALAPGGLLVGQQKQEIDVRPGGKKSPSVAALRDDGHPLSRGGVLRRIDMPGGEIVSQRNQSILERGEAFGASSPVTIGVELTPGRGSRIVDERAHALNQSRAKCGCLPRMGVGKLGRLVAEKIEVEIGGLLES